MAFFSTLFSGIVAGLTVIIIVAVYNATKNKLRSVATLLGLGKYLPKQNSSIPVITPGIYAPSMRYNNVGQNNNPCCMENNKDEKVDEYSEILKKFEENNERVIFIQPSMGSNIPFISSANGAISLTDAKKLVDIIQKSPEDINLSVIITTTGGTLTASEIITDALVNHKGMKKIYIPYFSFSGGTLIALAGNEIYLGRGACMGQVDPQFGIFGASTGIVKYVRKYVQALKDPIANKSFIDSLLLLIYENAEQSIERIEKIVRKACTSCNYTEEEYNVLRELLVEGKSNHDTPLFYNDVNGPIKQVINGIPENMSRLIELHEKENEKSSRQSILGNFI